MSDHGINEQLAAPLAHLAAWYAVDPQHAAVVFACVFAAHAVPRITAARSVCVACVGRWPPGLRVDPLLLYQDVRSYSARFLCNEACAPTQNTKIHSQGEGQGNVELQLYAEQPA